MAVLPSFEGRSSEATTRGNIKPAHEPSGRIQTAERGFSRIADPITGSFVFDNNLVPGNGTGVTNVPIPSALSFPVPGFDLTITAANSTTLHFDLGNELSSAHGGLDAQVQYNNGHFAGFAGLSCDNVTWIEIVTAAELGRACSGYG